VKIGQCDRMKQKISPVDYEKALFEKLVYEFQPSGCRVVWDDRSVTGRYSGVKRQLDVAVYRGNEDRPFLVADAKRRTRKIDVSVIESFMGQLDDVAAKIGAIASPLGFSGGAKRRATASNIRILVMSVDEALEMNWRVVAQMIFPGDPTFHPELAAALYRLQRGEEADRIVDAIEQVPLEEWQSFVAYGLSNRLPETADFLWFIAIHHDDDGWRFNAIERLIASGMLDQFDVNRLFSQEGDPEILQLLRESGFG